MFPSHDLYGIGRLIAGALDDEKLRDRLDADLGRAARRALEQVRDRLLRAAGDEHYSSVAQLRADWQKLHPRYLSPLGVPELGGPAQATASIATPTTLVSMTERALDVINHPLMQRLRNIPQLDSPTCCTRGRPTPDSSIRSGCSTPRGATSCTCCGIPASACSSSRPRSKPRYSPPSRTTSVTIRCLI